MKITSAVVILVTNLIIISVVFLILYLVIKPVVYEETPSTTLGTVIGQASVYLVSTARNTSYSPNLNYVTHNDISSSKVTISAAGVNDLTVLPSSSSSANSPARNNRFPFIFTSLTNLDLQESNIISAEVVVNTIAENTNRATPGVFVAMTYYYSYTISAFNEESVYITATGMYGENSLSSNNVDITMNQPGAGNYSLRLLLPDGSGAEVAYSDSVFGANATATIPSSFFSEQTLLLYNDATQVDTVTITSSTLASILVNADTITLTYT